MAMLRLSRPGSTVPRDGNGSWGELVAWFSELVRRLDKGDLAGAVEAQAHIEQFGFKVTYRRLRRSGREGGR